MAKQPSKPARADSSAGESAAAVSNNTDAVAAAAPATPKAPEAPAAAADASAPSVRQEDRAALLAVCRYMLEDVPGIVAELEAEARSSAQDQDHSQHALYCRLATVFGEFRTGLESVLNAPQV
jgi:hypothetical protein